MVQFAIWRSNCLVRSGLQVKYRHGSIDWKGKFTSYALLNARIGYQHKNFEVAVFGRNLLDRRYASNALDFRSFSTPDLLIRQQVNQTAEMSKSPMK